MIYVLYPSIPFVHSLQCCIFSDLRFDVYSFPHQILFLTRAIVMNLNCKILYVRFYILILVFFYLYVKIVTVRFHSVPHCDTNNHSPLQLSAYLSVPHSFETFNPNSDAISLSQR